jgi:hypothetical protein
LHSATSLAGLWHEQGRVAEASDLLAEVSQRFDKGFETANLREATRLIRLFRTGVSPSEPAVAHG